MTTQTENCRAIVVKFVDAFGDRRLDEALSLLHDKFIVHAAGDVPYSGDYLGPAGFLDLITKMSESLELTPSSEIQFLADGDKVVLHYRLRFTAPTSRRSVEMSMAEVFTVRDGLIVELDVFYQESFVGSRPTGDLVDFSSYRAVRDGLSGVQPGPRPASDGVAAS